MKRNASPTATFAAEMSTTLAANPDAREILAALATRFGLSCDLAKVRTIEAKHCNAVILDAVTAACRDLEAVQAALTEMLLGGAQDWRPGFAIAEDLYAA